MYIINNLYKMEEWHKALKTDNGMNLGKLFDKTFELNEFRLMEESKEDF
jgi:hypothetical protein